jgi:hypothetical protein
VYIIYTSENGYVQCDSLINQSLLMNFRESNKLRSSTSQKHTVYCSCLMCAPYYKLYDDKHREWLVNSCHYLWILLLSSFPVRNAIQTWYDSRLLQSYRYLKFKVILILRRTSGTFTCFERHKHDYKCTYSVTGIAQLRQYVTEWRNGQLLNQGISRVDPQNFPLCSPDITSPRISMENVVYECKVDRWE